MTLHRLYNRLPPFFPAASNREGRLFPVGGFHPERLTNAFRHIDNVSQGDGLGLFTHEKRVRYNLDAVGPQCNSHIQKLSLLDYVHLGEILS
jgi:hypothetical protein